MEFKEHPEWTLCYPAIDGITKPCKESGHDNQDNLSYKPPEDAVRSDVRELMELSIDDFLDWHETRLTVTQQELDRWRLITSTPHLRYGHSQYDLSANTALKNVVENLETGIEYLGKIKELYRETHPDDSLFLG